MILKTALKHEYRDLLALSKREAKSPNWLRAERRGLSYGGEEPAAFAALIVSSTPAAVGPSALKQLTSEARALPVL